MRWVIRLVGVLALVLGGILWWLSDDSSVDLGRRNNGDYAVSSKSVGTSTLGHGSLLPHPNAVQPSADPDHR